jgi:hypothetical protein
MNRSSKTIPAGQFKARLLWCLAVLAQGPRGALTDQASNSSNVVVESRTRGRRSSREGGDGSVERARRAIPILGHGLRALVLAFALVLCGFAVAVSSASAASFTWSGAAAQDAENWSNATNWEGGTAPGKSVETLSFPKLTSPACTAEPKTATCYFSRNDMVGVNVNAISIDDGVGYDISSLGGGFITLGAGGLSANTSTTGFEAFPAFLALGIVLGAPQTWTIDGNDFGFGVELGASVQGTSAALDVGLSHRGRLGIRSQEVEAGAARIIGSDPGDTGAAAPQNGEVEIQESGSLNATDGNPVELIDSELFSVEGGEVGPFTSKGGDVHVGLCCGSLPSGKLMVAGSVALDAATQVQLFINHAGTTAGADYSQISASGDVNLAGAQLSFGDHTFEGSCPTLHPGDVDTLVTTKEILSGTFSGIPNGATIPVICEGQESAGQTPPTVKISYTEHAVTATVETPGSPPPPVEISPPAISGPAQQGQTLNEAHGSWAFEPTSFTYAWQRCDGSGNNCQAIGGATGQTYTLTAADVGSTIRVQETASNEAGSGGPASSAATSVVQAASPVARVEGECVCIAPILAPILGQRETITALSGIVTIRVKGASKFVPLSGTSSIPDDSEVDATKGRVLITAATPKAGQTVSAEVYGGRFRIHQDANGETHFILTLALTGCPRVKLPHGSAAAVSAKRRSGPRSRHLWVSESGGKWGTNGRYVSTSVEGTRWLTTDECNQSQVKVAAGKVTVDDLVRKRTKTLKAGKLYVAVRRGAHRA